MLRRLIFWFSVESWDAELFGRVRLVPVAVFELVHNDAALDIFKDVEQGRVGVMFEQAGV